MKEKIIINNNEYVYIYKNNNNEELILLIHGFGSDKNEQGNFIKLEEKLNQNNYDTIRLDLHGHGESTGNSEDLTIDLTIKIINQILKDKLYKKISIIGTSYGGGIAVIYANNYPINKLILWSPLLDYNRNIINPENHFCREFLGKEALKNIKEKGYSEFGVSGKRINMNLFNDVKKYNPVDILKNISSKIKIIHGTKDYIIPIKQSIEISEKNNIDLTIIENGTHCFYDETIDEVIKMTINFLKNK